MGYSFKITTFPGILQRIINAFVAENRIVKFLEKYEATSYLLDSNFAETTCDKDNSKIALEIYGNFSWTGDFNNSPENFMLNEYFFNQKINSNDFNLNKNLFKF